jgi:hypothetical protein
MQDDLAMEQAAADLSNEQATLFCQSENERLKNEIADKSDQITNLEQTIASYASQSMTAESSRADTDALLSTTRSDCDSTQKNLSDKLAALKADLKVARYVYNMVAGKYNPNNAESIPSADEEQQTELLFKHAESLHHNSHRIALLSAIAKLKLGSAAASMGEKERLEAAGKVVNLLADLYVTIADEIRATEDALARNKSTCDFNIADLHNRISSLTQQLSSLAMSTQQAQLAMTNAQNIRDAKNSELAILIQNCDTASSEYKSKTDSRTTENELLNEVINEIKKLLGDRQWVDDCQVGEWSEWSECSASCDGGVTVRTRSITQEQKNNGLQCPELKQTMECNTQACPVDCVMSDWSQWSDCSASCGGGHQTRGRTIVTAAEHGGVPCGETLQSQVCNAAACPVDCQLSSWSSWSKCSASCGGGVMSRQRDILVAPSNGGAQCEATQEQDSCNTQQCGSCLVATLYEHAFSEGRYIKLESSCPWETCFSQLNFNDITSSISIAPGPTYTEGDQAVFYQHNNYGATLTSGPGYIDFYTILYAGMNDQISSVEFRCQRA